MTYGIICAMGEELAILQGKLENEASKKVGHTEFFEGTIADQPVVIVQSGIGKVQAAITASILINDFNVDALINSGSAGGIGEGLSVGEVVVSSQTAYHDVDVTASNYEVGQLPGLPARFDADEELVDEIMAAAKESGMKSQRGLIVSGDQFIADSQKIATIKKNFPDALCCEMEGAAIGQVAYENNIPYAVIRAMSDVGDENADQSFDEFIIDAGKRSGQMLINLFEDQASRK
ncbi:5'-methylthioadenosine/adenosylhomocysteine nucleosidase [Lentilactobacillus sp. SPB1-3]|uniref:5'-methylthioadenosine/adenosylhomocysteine nucleosidase n=1 Tax=Lentilactobacillus terminaliae TaxID=3003483 RepID=A0ACD5DDP7_9LACO|nr:5'-methylthioadenosine/adenosylhomocysteine nucleosidase [Lentilactobacillus sp. SPB1-3]MCZ0977839.1 5'-methylthioadenosine/adenosylhomocysteine nucleosidase [Lentilactobacillus sp. SPB1-3]